MNQLKCLLLSLLMPALLFAQKSENLHQHYNNELRTFKEAMIRSEQMNPDTNIDVKFYHLELDISIGAPFLQATSTIIFEPKAENLNEISLDLHGSLEVESISGPVVSFEHSSPELKIYLDDSFNQGEPVELSIHYQGVPVLAGGYKGMRYETHGSNEPVIATLSTPFVAHYWFPCKDGPSDKPDSVYIDIKIPDTIIDGVPLKGVSNGVLEGTEIVGNKKVFKWRHRYPVVTYYMMAAVSNYETIEETYTGNYGEEFPLTYHVFNESYNSALQGVQDMPLAMDVFSDLFGVYPFANEIYGMTQLGYYGAIENQTNTIINNMSTGWFMISVHELAHMWFGDMITCADWHHGWLNEGFATYSEALYVEAQQGTNAYLSYMQGEEYYNGGSLYVENITDTFNIFQPLIYSKGSYVLHMLRGVLGDEAFFAGVKNYATHPDLTYGQATSEDLQIIMEEAAGYDLDFYFDQWIYDEYFPVYKYNYLNEPSSNISYVSLKQTQEEAGRRPMFEMPVQLKLFLQNGTDTLITVWNDLKVQTFELELESDITFVQVDPYGWLLDISTYDPDLIVELNDLDETNGIWIFPNPVKNELNIKIDPGSKFNEIRIYSLGGKVIWSKPLITLSEQIDISELKTSTYILKVVGQNSAKVQRFVKH